MRPAIWLSICLFTLMGPAQAQTSPAPTDNPIISSAEIRELLEAAKATAKATRENVDYNRVVPDILFQILTKLDKIENKLDKIENALKRNRATRTRARQS